MLDRNKKLSFADQNAVSMHVSAGMADKNIFMIKLKNILLLCFFIISTQLSAQLVGDFGSIASGNYTASGTWGIWNGATWVAAPGGAVPGVNYPNNTTNVYINSGTTVVVNTSGVSCLTLNVVLGGKIWANTVVTNVYLYVFGDIISNGVLGNGASFDGISLGIEGTVCNATGTGTIDVSRIRKNTNTNPITTFNIIRDINLRFASSSQTQIYNNATAGPSRFDVVIASGATLNLTTNGASTGNAAIDADLIGLGNNQTAGSFTINGTMIVSGITYLATNNTGGNLAGITTVAGSNTVTATSTASLVAGMTVIGTGTLLGTFPSGTVITAVLNATTFTISNNAVLSASGNINYGGSCYWLINSGGILRTGQVSTAYATLTCTTTAASFAVTTASTNGLTVGSSITGTGIPPGATITSITNATTFVISAAATGTGTNSMLTSAGNAGHMLRIMPGGTMEVTGTSGFNAALPTINNTYDIQSGSFFEYSGSGNQNVALIPASSSTAFGNSTNAYGYLKISGSGIKNQFNSGNYNIANDLNIVNTTGSPTLASNNQTIRMLGGSWYNYNTTGYDEQLATVVFLGSVTQTINTPGGERFYRLTFSKLSASTLQFNCPVNVINQLAWTTNGPIFLNSNRLTIENSATTAINNSANAARYIISETITNLSIVQWNVGSTLGAANYVFPFGKPGVPDYIPFTYSLSAATNVGNLSVATYGTPPNNLPWPISPYNVNNLNSTTGLLPDNRDATVDRFWEIDVTAGSPSATVTFTYASSELPVAPFNNMALMQGQWYNSATDKWIPPTAGQTTGTYSTTTPGVVTYGAWTLAAITSPLPIKLLSFDATPNHETVDLEWVTATEINNDHFTLERSVNGIDFEPIGSVKGAGNSSRTLNYLFVDERPLYGVSYYRLKQTDFDGKYSYSQIVAIRISKDNAIFIQAGPVPAKDHIRLTCTGSTNFSPELYELDGRLIRSFPILTDGYSDLDISDLAKGTYLLRITTDTYQKSLRIIKD